MSARPIDPRRDFAVPADVAWLNTAHQGALPRVALDAARRAVRLKADPSRIDDGDFFEVPDRLRGALAGLLGVPADEVVLGDSASHGLHLLAAGLGFEEGDEILLVRDDFPATVTPWLPLRRSGVRIRFLPERAALTPERVADALRPETRVFCTTWVDSFTGHTLDVKAVGSACAEADVRFVLNATQGLGARPLPVSSLPVDAVTCSGYKWLCGPYGTGFAWIRRTFMDTLDPGRHYWLPSVRETGLDDMGRTVHAIPTPGPERLDVFCPASFFNHLPWIAALEYLAEVGLEAAAAHNRRLVEAARQVVEGGGHRVLEPSGSEPPPMLLFEPVGQDAPELVGRLEEVGCHVSLRNGRVRISPHLQNDADDIDRFRQGARW